MEWNPAPEDGNGHQATTHPPFAPDGVRRVRSTGHEVPRAPTGWVGLFAVGRTDLSVEDDDRRIVWPVDWWVQLISRRVCPRCTAPRRLGTSSLRYRDLRW